MLVAVDKPVVMLHGEIKTPPLSADTRKWAGFLLRALQRGKALSLPESRPMPSIGARCHELRLRDAKARIIWRIVYRVDSDAIVIADVFAKKTQKTPKDAMERCQKRLREYDEDRKTT